MPGLPPGERYKAVALSYIEQDESQDPEFLDRIQSSGTEFTLSAGEKKRLTLTPVAR